MASLLFEAGPRTGERVEIDKARLVFGRHLSCDCVLNHATVSREHFVIELNGGKYFLVDQKSGNGTLVNGERISWIEIKSGDKIQAGPFIIRVELSDDERKEAAQTEALDIAGEAAETQVISVTVDESLLRLYPREYFEGISHFNSGRYFDAHEVWEQVWLHSSGEAKLFYQTLIQAAVGLHHYERGNLRGALGMRRNVTEKLEQLPDMFMSLDLAKFRRDFEDYFAGVEDEGDDKAGSKQKTPLVLTLLSDAAE